MSARNELFDESLEVLRGVWNEVPFAYQGKHFSARGVASSWHRHRRRAGGQGQGSPRGGGGQRRRRPLTIQVHIPQAGFMQRPVSAEEHRDHLGQLGFRAPP
jgi:hypothetical protein